MADQADIANDYLALSLTHALDRARAQDTPTLKPDGACHNCGKDVEGLRLFCDAECAQQHGRRTKRV